MDNYTIYHNNRCAKSREGLKYLQEKLGEENQDKIKVVNYMYDKLSTYDIKKIAQKLRMSPMEFTRTKEKAFAEMGLNEYSSDDEIITAMENEPKLIERPIVVNETTDRAVVARPASLIENIL
jgi:arsenate reductase